MDEKKQNSDEFLYEELCENYRLQENSVNFLNNKLYWLMSLNAGFIGFFFIKQKEISSFEFVSIVFFIISLVSSCWGTWTQVYKRGPKLEELFNEIKKQPYQKILQAYNKKLLHNIEKNQNPIKNLTFSIKISIRSFILGIVTLLPSLIK